MGLSIAAQGDHGTSSNHQPNDQHNQNENKWCTIVKLKAINADMLQHVPRTLYIIMTE